MTKTRIEHKLETPLDAVRFITGGRALFTARSMKTSNRFTFRVSLSKKFGDALLVTLVNSANWRNCYLGQIITENGKLKFIRTRNSQLTFDAIEVRAIRWIIDHLNGQQLPPKLEIWHEGRCGICGRVLTVPESIERGIGPECWTKRYQRAA